MSQTNETPQVLHGWWSDQQAEHYRETAESGAYVSDREPAPTRWTPRRLRGRGDLGNPEPRRPRHRVGRYPVRRRGRAVCQAEANEETPPMTTPAKVITPSAMQCRICGGPGDLAESGIYVCRDNPTHVADRFTGIWSDLALPPDDTKDPRA